MEIGLVWEKLKAVLIGFLFISIFKLSINLDYY